MWEQVNDNTNRIEALETWQEQVNNNIAALQQLLNTTDYITSVAPVTLNGKEVGYTISFHNSDPITIYHGEKGDKGDKGDQGEQGEQGIQGEPGKDGADGADGSDGKDGDTPQIGLQQGDDGNWYWTLNGSLMTDPDGNPIRANGEDGKDGEPGDDGEPGSDGKPGAAGEDSDPAPTPQILLGSNLPSGGKVMTDNGTAQAGAWYLSVDDGKTWYRISGDKGNDGNNGDDGVLKVEPAEDGNSVTITFDDNSSITLPTWQWAQSIDKQIDELNKQLEAYGKFMQGKTFITNVEPTENGQQITYITIGEDGKETTGSFEIANGKDGAMPTVEIGDNGNWFIDGTDTGKTAKGEDGADGKTPTFKIEDGYLYYQFEEDGDWEKLDYKLTGPKGDQGDPGEDGDSFFSDVKYTAGDANAVFTLANGGGSFTVPVYQSLRILTAAEHDGSSTFDNGTASVTPDGTTFYLSMNEGTDYKAIAAEVTPLGDDAVLTRSSGWSAAVNQTGEDITITVTAPAAKGKALLRVTLIRTDGSEQTTSRIVEVAYTIDNTGTYIVYTAEGLKAWATATQDDKSISCTLDADITLSAPAEGSSRNWTPVGELYSPYTGAFDGAGHTVSGIDAGSSGVDYRGFFGVIAKSGSVKNLHLIGAQIHGSSSVGGIAGSNSGTIADCSVSGTEIIADSYSPLHFGGIAGQNSGTITACSVSNTTVSGAYVGGIAGSNSYDGKIIACRVSGSTISGGYVIGGIVGCYNQANIIAACSVSDCEISGSRSIGGIIGENRSSTATACYWQSESVDKGIGDGEGEAIKVDGTDVTWKDATEAMNTAITTWNSENENACPYHYEQKGDANTPPVIVDGAPQ